MKTMRELRDNNNEVTIFLEKFGVYQQPSGFFDKRICEWGLGD